MIELRKFFSPHIISKTTLVGKRAAKVQLCNKQRKFRCLLYGRKEGKQPSLEKLEWNLLLICGNEPYIFSIWLLKAPEEEFGFNMK